MRRAGLWIGVTGALLLVAIALWIWTANSTARFEAACREALKRRNWNQLASLAEAWTKSDPSNPVAWLHRADAAQNLQDFASACEYLKQIPPTSEVGLRALESRIEIQFRHLNRPQDAADSCRLLLEHDPDSSLAQQRLIFYYAFTLQRRQLIDQIHDAVRRGTEPREAYPYLFFADALQIKNGFAQNVAWAEANPGNELFEVSQAIHIAESLEGSIPRDDPRILEQHRAGAARRDRILTELLSKYPHNLELLNFFMRRAMDQGDVARVRELLLQSPAEGELDNRFWRYRGWLMQSEDQLDAAEAAFREAIRLHSLDWGTRHQLAGLLRRKGQLNEAARMESLVMQSGKLRRAMLEQESVSSTAQGVLVTLSNYAAGCGDMLIANSLRSQMRRYRPNMGLPAESEPNHEDAADASRASTRTTSKVPASPKRLLAGIASMGTQPTARKPVQLVAPPQFRDVAAESGVDFTYDNGSRGRRLMVEGTGGGAGWLDYDGDGLWDLYLVQGGDPVAPEAESQPADKLFRNQGMGKFTEVTTFAAVVERRFGQGISVGDFDGDGFDDVFVANVGGDSLFHNQGDGTFKDVTATLGGNRAEWSASAAWADLDLDGDLDLFVCRYCQFDPLHPQPCTNSQGRRSMCQPKQVPAVADVLFINQGDGSFREESRERGVVGHDSRALGVAILDFNNDQWPDIFVGNDATPNSLFINDQQGKFQDQAVQLGCSVLLNGHAQGSMGLGIGDYDRNGFLDLFISNFEGEGDSLYQNGGPLGFQEVSGVTGLVQPTVMNVGWGTVMADFNQDGHEDLFVANGHIDDGRHVGGDLEQPAQLFCFNGDRWVEESSRGGEFFQRKYLGRGVASCDFDDDGDLDLVMVSQNARAALLRNESPRGHWLKLSFVGKSGNRRAIGTRVTVRTGEKVLVQELAAGTSYCAAHQPALLFGLAGSAEPCDIEIRWPGGAVQQISAVTADQSLVIREP